MDLRAAVIVLATLGCGDDGNVGVASTSGGEATTTTTSEAPSGTSESSSGSSTAGIEPEVDWPHLACDPLVESLCALPFPNNVFTVADPSTPTGRRVALDPSATPVHANGTAADPQAFARSDGFSTSAAMLAHLPGATSTGLPSPLDIGRSVQADTPTIVLDAESGELHPHFAEVDVSTVDVDRRAFIIRPVVPLLPGRRYIVAIRGVVDAAGAVLPPTPAFAALRDGTPDPLIEDRRGLYEDIFGRLQPFAARDELQLAWDFTTASVHDSTSTMIAMRDDALAVVGDEGPAYTLDDLQMDPLPDVALRIEGTMSVPLYLDDPGPGGALVLDDEGRPQQNGVAEVPFLVIVPASAARAPAGILHIGHGLLGERFQAEADYYRTFADENGWVIVATDWIGMANEDVPHILGIIGTGELDRFHTVCDRLQQGVLNAVLVIRLLATGLADDPLLAGMIDPSRVAYVGASQGGILGGVLAAVSPDIQRAVLDVPGQPYNLLLERSVDFSPFLNVLRTGYTDPLQVQMVLVLAQMLWDRAEPAGYTRHLREDPLPGSGAKDVLLQVAIGDHQVTTLGAHVMARAIGAPNLVPANREIWGLATAEGSAEGVGMIEYDFGLPPEPIANVPMEEGEDPHGLVRRLPAAVQTRAQFLATGTIETFCDGPCDPE